ncbi:hypothetical protein EVAR_100053_1 [Eumeta japonica]|uniref:Uncharacterized protein n=1 Tax=Eumeta variegata TaxID=151549 RepID=A0A4C1ZWV6_EUMVA|nr:hypothetical protein EVAR_100053_1 [Eumeta japonica]
MKTSCHERALLARLTVTATTHARRRHIQKYDYAASNSEGVTMCPFRRRRMVFLRDRGVDVLLNVNKVTCLDLGGTDANYTRQTKQLLTRYYLTLHWQTSHDDVSQWRRIGSRGSRRNGRVVSSLSNGIILKRFGAAEFRALFKLLKIIIGDWLLAYSYVQSEDQDSIWMQKRER